MDCPKCNKENMNSAKFCRHCGTKLPEPAAPKPPTAIVSLDDIVGLEPIKQELVALMAKAKMQKERSAAGMPTNPIQVHSVFKGDTGTGKTALSRYLAQALNEIGVLSKGSYTEISSQTLAAVEGSREVFVLDTLKKGAGGVVIFDKIHEADGWIPVIVEVLKVPRADVVIIIAGLAAKLDEYFQEHPDDLQRFSYHFNFPALTVDQLKQISLNQLRRMGYRLAQDAETEFGQYMNQVRYAAEAAYKNGWIVEKVAIPQLLNKQSQRLESLPSRSSDDLSQILRDDIPSANEARKSPEEVLDSLDEFVGLEATKAALRELHATLLVQKEKAKRGLVPGSFSVHFVFTGNPGTGKTTLARRLGELFYAMELLPTSKVVETDKAKLVAQYVGQTGPNVNRFCDMAMGGVLFVDEAYELSGEEGEHNAFGKEAVETLMKRMEDDRGKFVVVAAGYKNLMKRFLTLNPGIKSRFTHYLDLPDYTADQLFTILEGQVRKEDMTLDTGGKEAAKKALKEIWAKRGETFGNARDVRKLFEASKQKQGTRLGQSPDRSNTELTTLTAADIAYDFGNEQTPEQIMAELNELIGMAEVKKSIRDLIDFVQFQKLRSQDGTQPKLSNHLILTGNPGTGKTTVARILGKLYKAIGILPGDNFVETQKADLVSPYVSQSGEKISGVIDQAMGGVLFIDEAYQLTPEQGTDAHSQEAIDTLMKKMEDARDRLVVIAAGYREDMERFLASNSGLPSRFNKRIHFEDYSPDELMQIFEKMVAGQGYFLSAAAREAARAQVGEIHAARDKKFANARAMRNLFETVIIRQAERCSKLLAQGQELDKVAISTVEVEDLAAQKVETKDPMLELEQLVGLGSVKQEIQKLIATLEVEKSRLQPGEASTAIGKHYLFVGNPGTGKTTVARILAKIFGHLQLVSQGQLVECDRSGLVGQYIGETEFKTTAAIDRAMGGVLFVDEAYGLVSGGESDFGQQAVVKLLKRMEDDRGKFIVIAAGYEDDMAKFVNSNPGLASRFSTTLRFDDYSAEELFEIFSRLCSQHRMTMEPEFTNLAKQHLERMYSARGREFANGRDVRTFFERTRERQALRLQPLLKSGEIVPQSQDSRLFMFAKEDLE